MSSRTPELSPREAAQRWIRARRTDWRESTASAHWYRLKLFIEWCEERGIESVTDLDGWLIDEYQTERSGKGIATTSAQNEAKTLRAWFDYLERIEIVDGLSEKVHVPELERSEETTEETLPASRALPLLRSFRISEARGTREHAFLELAWHIGARLGGLRSLDLRDVALEEAYIEFVHRSETGTPLKNGVDGQRVVAIPDGVADELAYYIQSSRYDVHDEYGRQPFLTSRQGRPTTGTLRRDCYRATWPCRYRECPHGKEPATCEYKHRNHEHECPSVRSPHRLRSGSITWQRDQGIPAEVVAERVNATVDVIERHYDKATQHQRMEERRRGYVDSLDIDEETDKK